MKRKTILQALTLMAICWCGSRLLRFLAEDYGFSLAMVLSMCLALGMLMLVGFAVAKRLHK